MLIISKFSLNQFTMEYPISNKTIFKRNLSVIINKAKPQNSNKRKEIINYYLYNYILIKILHINFIFNTYKPNQNQNKIVNYKIIEDFLKKVLSVEGLGKCKITINYLLNQYNINDYKIHIKLYNIMDKEIPFNF